MEIFEKSVFSDKLRARLCDWEENEPGCEQRVRRFSDKNRSHGGGLSELVGGFVLKARGFSDKTGREEAFCRNELAVLCRELWDSPTN